MEPALSLSDIERVRDMVPPSMSLPEVSSADNFIIELWGEMKSSLAQGCQLDLLRWRCETVGLSGLAELEVWARCRLVDSEVEAFLELLRKNHG